MAYNNNRQSDDKNKKKNTRNFDPVKNSRRDDKGDRNNSRAPKKGAGGKFERKGNDRPPRREDRREERRDYEDSFMNSESYEQYNKVFGRNAVREALKADRNINKLYIAKGETDHTLTLIVAMAKDRGINISYTDRRKLDFFTNNQNHQGVVAVCSPVEFVSVEEILISAREKGEKPFVVMLDGITDPHNAGAIIRSAYCAGAHGIIISKRRSALISEGVFKASAGSVEYLPVSQVANLAQTIDMLKKEGLFAVCCDMDGTDYTEIDYDMPMLLIIGAEGEGVGRLIREKCDFVASIPIKGNIDSLNASVAAGIVMFEAVKYRK